MKKIIAICLMASLAVMTLGPALSVATTPGPIDTGLTRSTGGGANPIIKAKWEMDGPYALLLGTDYSPTAGAQFAPPGVWDGTKQFSICAIVTDPDGMSDIDGVYTDWYFPSDRAFHPAPTGTYADLINGGAGSKPDYGLSGCGLPYEDENELTKLAKMDGYELFCETIRNNNNNLPTFFPMPTTGLYTYDEICGDTGELMKDTAYVYCADKQLIWEDPAGDYKVEILALDAAGLFSHAGTSNPNYNHFEYVQMSGFEADFTQVEYGSVKLNTHKRISGDKTFGTTHLPSVRNTGNVRLYMWVEQDDMGLSTTDGVSNVKYDARVGNNEADWKNYWPDANTKLQDILDLSEVEEMDFSVLITKFPTTEDRWVGDMVLSSSPANFRQCLPDQTDKN